MDGLWTAQHPRRTRPLSPKADVARFCSHIYQIIQKHRTVDPGSMRFHILSTEALSCMLCSEIPSRCHLTARLIYVHKLHTSPLTQPAKYLSPPLTLSSSLQHPFSHKHRPSNPTPKQSPHDSLLLLILSQPHQHIHMDLAQPSKGISAGTRAPAKQNQRPC